MSNCELTPHRFRIFALWLEITSHTTKRQCAAPPTTQTQFINLKMKTL